jgi:hypothetical protein
MVLPTSWDGDESLSFGREPRWLPEPKIQHPWGLVLDTLLDWLAVEVPRVVRERHLNVVGGARQFLPNLSWIQFAADAAWAPRRSPPTSRHPAPPGAGDTTSFESRMFSSVKSYQVLFSPARVQRWSLWFSGSSRTAFGGACRCSIRSLYDHPLFLDASPALGSAGERRRERITSTWGCRHRGHFNSKRTWPA